MKFEMMQPLGVRFSDFDASDPEHIQAFADAYKAHSLVLIQDPKLTDDQHVALMASIGPVAADRPAGPVVSFLDHVPEKYKGFDSKTSSSGKFDDGELLFHFDFAFNDDWPCDAISLYAINIPPEGGDTLFVHGSEAYKRVPDALKVKIEGRKFINVFDPYKTNGAIRTRESTLGRYPERGMHDVVRPNPGGDGPALAVCLSATDRILGIPRAESEEILNELFGLLYDEAHVLRHRWTPGDLVVWNNHFVQHSRETFDYRCRRTLRRVINGDEATIQKRVTRWRLQQVDDEALVA